MKKTYLFILMAIFVTALSSCDNYGTKKMIDSTELYYTDEVTEAEADALGDYLKEIEFNDDDETITVQLTKEGDTYQFRMVMKEGYADDDETIEMAEEFAYFLSRDVFDGEEVEMHLCDEELKTLKVVQMKEPTEEGETLEFDGTEIEFDSSVDVEDVEAVGSYLIESGFTDGTTKSILLTKEDGTYSFSMVSSEEYWNDSDFLVLVKEFAKTMSATALNNEPVEIILCDEYFKPKKHIRM